MKKIFLSLFAVTASFFFAQASHFAGGDLQYRYIGDSTGIPNQYEFTLRLYRDVSGIAMPNNIDLNICSSCYASSFINLPQVGPAQLAPTLFDCVEPSAPGTVSMEVYLYRNVGTLPGNCSDFEFITEGLNARNNAIDNLNLGSGNSNLIITAELNNNLGNNSSPFFVSEPVRAFCVGRQFNWTQSAVESDGDSLVFKMYNVKGGAFGLTCAPVQYNYQAGWSYTQPVTNFGATQLTMNPKSGLITFTPGAVEVDVIGVAVEEWRFDTIYTQWVKIGEATRDMQITVSPNCSPIAQAGVNLDYNSPGYYPDPVSGLPTVDYPCLDSSIVLKFATKLDCSSISPDGTDFRLTAPNGQPIPVKSLVANCDVNNESKEITVNLHEPLAINGKYFLYSKLGNDGNTLLNKCGFAMDEFDTIQLNVTGCFTTQIEMRNVSITDDDYPTIQWELDTSNNYPTYLADGYKIYRSDNNGAAYQQIYQINDYKINSFNDQSVGPTDVDAQTYHYKVEALVTNLVAATSNDINSILLETQDGLPIFEPADEIDLKWTTYVAWPSPEYTVTLGTLDPNTGLYSDVPHVATGGQNNPTFDLQYNMLNTGFDAGDYRVCVRADYPGGSGPYEAWSNCLTFRINEPILPPVDTPTTVSIPNIITPNGDGQNDLLTIANIETWQTTRSVKIFNRWGNIVFETEDYENATSWNGQDKNGRNVADGVYFYVIELYDQASDKRKKLNGDITVTGNVN